MSRHKFELVRRAVLIMSTAFAAVYLSSMIAVRAHEQATCCLDPCSTWQGTSTPCQCNGPCGYSEHNHIFYFNPDCNPIEDEDTCVRGNCFLYDDLGAGCNVQCCADDFSYCL